MIYSPVFDCTRGVSSLHCVHLFTLDAFMSLFFSLFAPFLLHRHLPGAIYEVKRETKHEREREDLVVSAIPRLSFKCMKVSDQMYTKSKYERAEQKEEEEEAEKKVTSTYMYTLRYHEE